VKHGQAVKLVFFPSPFFLWWMQSFFYVRGFPMRFFNGASEDTGVSLFFSPVLLLVATLTMSFSPSLLRSFASSVRGASRNDRPEAASGDDGP